MLPCYLVFISFISLPLATVNGNNIRMSHFSNGLLHSSDHRHDSNKTCVAELSKKPQVSYNEADEDLSNYMDSLNEFLVPDEDGMNDFGPLPTKESSRYLSICSQKNYSTKQPRFKRVVDFSLLEFKYFARESNCAYANTGIPDKIKCDSSFQTLHATYDTMVPIVLKLSGNDTSNRLLFENSDAYLKHLYMDHTIGYMTLKKHIKRIVFSFHGTSSIEDGITDIVFKIHDFKNLKVHSGFFMAANRSHEAIIKILKNWIRKGLISDLHDYELVYTGHSLGGALATLSSVIMMLDTSFNNMRTCGMNINFHNQIKVVTFGSPRVFAKESSRSFEGILRHDNHARFADPSDVVPLLPPEFLGFSHTGVLLETLDTEAVNKINRKEIKASNQNQESLFFARIRNQVNELSDHISMENSLYRKYHKKGRESIKTLKNSFQKFLLNVKKSLKGFTMLKVHSAYVSGKKAIKSFLKRANVLKYHGVTRYFSNIPNTLAFLPKWGLSRPRQRKCSAEILEKSVASMFGIYGNSDVIASQVPTISCRDVDDIYVECFYIANSGATPNKILRYRRELNLHQCKSQVKWKQPVLKSEVHKCLYSNFIQHNQVVFHVDKNLIDFTSPMSQCYKPSLVTSGCGFSLETSFEDIVNLVKTTSLDQVIWGFFKVPLSITPPKCRKYVFRGDTQSLFSDEWDSQGWKSIEKEHQIDLTSLVRYGLDNSLFKTTIPDKIIVDRVAAKYKEPGKVYNYDVYKVYERDFGSMSLQDVHIRQNIPLIENVPFNEFSSCINDPEIAWWDCSTEETKDDQKFCPDHCKISGSDRFCNFVKACHLKNSTARFVSLIASPETSNTTIYSSLASNFSLNPSDSFLLYDLSIKNAPYQKVYLSFVFKIKNKNNDIPEYKDPFKGRRRDHPAISKWFNFVEEDRIEGIKSIVYPTIVSESISDGLRQLGNALNLVYNHYHSNRQIKNERSYFEKRKNFLYLKYQDEWKTSQSNSTAFVDVLDMIDDHEAIEVAMVTSYSVKVPKGFSRFINWNRNKTTSSNFFKRTYNMIAEKITQTFNPSKNTIQFDLNYFMALISPIMYNSIRSMAIHVYAMNNAHNGIGDNLRNLTRLMDVECKTKPLFLAPMHSNDFDLAISVAADAVSSCVEERLGINRETLKFTHGIDFRRLLAGNLDQFRHSFKDIYNLTNGMNKELGGKIMVRTLMTVFNLREKIIGDGLFDMKAWFTICNDIFYRHILVLNKLYDKLLDPQTLNSTLKRLDEDDEFAKKLLTDFNCSAPLMASDDLNEKMRIRFAAKECLIQMKENYGNYSSNYRLDAINLGILHLKNVLVESQVPLILSQEKKLTLTTENVENTVQASMNQKLYKKSNMTMETFKSSLTIDLIDDIVLSRSRVKLLKSIYRRIAIVTLDNLHGRFVENYHNSSSDWRVMFDDLAVNPKFMKKSIYPLPRTLTNYGLSRYVEYGNSIKFLFPESRLSVFAEKDFGVLLAFRSPLTMGEAFSCYMRRNGPKIAKCGLLFASLAVSIASIILTGGATFAPGAAVAASCLDALSTILFVTRITVSVSKLGYKLSKMNFGPPEIDYISYSATKQVQVQKNMYQNLNTINDYFLNPESFNFDMKWMGVKGGVLHNLAKQTIRHLETLDLLMNTARFINVLNMAMSSRWHLMKKLEVLGHGIVAFDDDVADSIKENADLYNHGIAEHINGGDGGIPDLANGDVFDPDINQFQDYHGDYLIDHAEWSEFMEHTREIFDQNPVLDFIWEHFLEDIFEAVFNVIQTLA